MFIRNFEDEDEDEDEGRSLVQENHGMDLGRAAISSAPGSRGGEDPSRFARRLRWLREEQRGRRKSRSTSAGNPAIYPARGGPSFQASLQPESTRRTRMHHPRPG